ncbi:MAG: formimidoylglutamase [Bacteroidales bacterium]|nr:formimidoylglutamase [Bacteroidales bacterium]
MELSVYLNPVEGLPEYEGPVRGRLLGAYIKRYMTNDAFPDLSDSKIAIVGVEEDRQSLNNKGAAKAPDRIRQHLYELYPERASIQVADIGNIIQGNTVVDTYFALSSVMTTLLENNIIPVVIGGTQDLTYSMYQAYATMKKIINIAAVDSRFDLGELEKEITPTSYLSHIIKEKPNYLFNFTNLGYQTYFVDQTAIKTMSKLFFDTYRLGSVRSDIYEAEPIIRNAHLLSFDISAIRQSDAPANANATPNGFYGEEACQILRYAGLSDRLSSLGIFEVNPDYDNHGQTAHLAAQMIWYFIDGFLCRTPESPFERHEKFIKYHVQVEDHKENITFYRSKKSERWWMEIKAPDNIKPQYRHHYMIPCSEADYQAACNNDIPDRWWKAYQKLM